MFARGIVDEGVGLLADFDRFAPGLERLEIERDDRVAFATRDKSPVELRRRRYPVGRGPGQGKGSV